MACLTRQTKFATDDIQQPLRQVSAYETPLRSDRVPKCLSEVARERLEGVPGVTEFADDN